MRPCDSSTSFWSATLAANRAGGLMPHGPDEPGDVDAHEERLAWMRAEFRAAQQRRYEKRAIALVNRSLTAKPPPSEVKPPTLATPSR